MDNNVVAAKMEKIAKPIQRPVSVTPSQPKSTLPPAAKPVNVERGSVVDVEAPQGTPGVQPTLMEKSNAEDLIPTDPWETSPMFYELAQFFNIEPKFYNAEKDKISVITDYAIQKAGSNKLEDIYHVIRELTGNLMKMDAFEPTHNLLYRYLRLAAHADAANKAKKAFERGPMTNE